MKRFLDLALLVPVTAAAISEAAASEFLGVTPELISESETIVAGPTLTVGLSLKHEEPCHTYRDPPGTVGVATSLVWELPDGPAPARDLLGSRETPSPAVIGSQDP